jgi:hypothetical protein|tara:strand:- start:43 stop:234 length:192 start_codon:yes stop_codon:yes gene_type:complete
LFFFIKEEKIYIRGKDMGKTLKIRYEYEDGSKYIGEYYEIEEEDYISLIWHGKGRLMEQRTFY